jgi:hypothetical protein
MNSTLQIILPSFILPALFSFSLLGITLKSNYIYRVLAIVWLPSYFWINGGPNFLSIATNDWLWAVALLSIVSIALFRQQKYSGIAQSVILLAALIALAWPLQHLFNTEFMMSLIFVFIAGSLIFYLPRERRVMPVTNLAVSSTGLGVVAALTGSLLVGQLAIALASLISAFSIKELVNQYGKQKKQASIINTLSLEPFILLYVLLLVIARVYTDLAIAPFMLLLLAPIAGMFIRWRLSPFTSAVFVFSALVWLLLNSDSSSYY